MEKVVWDLKAHPELWDEGNVFDCLIAEFALSEGRNVVSEDAVLRKYKAKDLQDLAKKQKDKLENLPRLKKLISEVEIPLASVLGKMEKSGISLDIVCLQRIGKELEEEIGEIEKEIRKEIGEEINLNSSVQVGNFLAEKLGVPLKKTKTGRFATNESELLQHAVQFPFIKKLLAYRELSKLLSTYVESLINKADESGRLHTTYNQVFVSTGRLSSSNPNLQNIPVTSDYGRKIKACFVAEKGKVLLSFDYSQQELRILAHLTGEKKLINAFRENRDIHQTTASQLFSVPYEKVTKEQRMIAKTINFGIIYGMSSYGMSMNLTIPVEEAQAFIDAFYANYPAIKRYYDQYLKEGKINGYVETLLGRRRFVFAYPAQKFIDNSMRRVLMNFPIQGTAADLTKTAMVRIQKEILDNDPNLKMLLQIHDDLVFEVIDDKEKISEIVPRIKNIMCSVYPLSVPIEVSAKKGKNWGELVELK